LRQLRVDRSRWYANGSQLFDVAESMNNFDSSLLMSLFRPGQRESRPGSDHAASASIVFRFSKP
jgi:hypothetical protein